jgi:hypothetical protein
MSVTSDADLEPRPLPSTGITRLRRYYGPLRHPKRPGLSLAGVRLRGTPPHRMGFPCCVRSPCTGMLSSIPRWPAGSDRSWDGLFQPFPCSPAATAFPKQGLGRRTHWTFRGLLNVHLRYGLPARCIAKRYICLEGSDGFVSSPRRFDSYRLERTSCRVGVTPTEDQHLLHGARRVEMWRGGFRLGLSVSGSFVCRCLTSFAMAPFPHPAHQTGRAIFSHPAFGQGFTSYSASHVRPRTIAATFLEAGTIPAFGTDVGRGTVLFPDPVP